MNEMKFYAELELNELLDIREIVSDRITELKYDIKTAKELGIGCTFDETRLAKAEAIMQIVEKAIDESARREEAV